MLNTPGVGVCYGMSLLALMNLRDTMDPAEIDSSAVYLHDLDIQNDAVKSALSYHSVLQLAVNFYAMHEDDSTDNSADKLEYLVELLKSGRPALVGYYKRGQSSHAVLAYGIRFSEEPVSETEYDCTILVYDPDDNQCLDGNNIKFNTQTRKWCTGGYTEMGSDVEYSRIDYVTDNLDILAAGSPYYHSDQEKPLRFYPNMSLENMPDDVPAPIRMKKNGGNWQEAGEDKSVTENRFFFDDDVRNFVMRYNTESYRFQYDDGRTDKVDIEMLYQKSLFDFKSDAARSVLFSPNSMEIEMDAVPYTIRSIWNRDVNKTGFYDVRIEGDRGGKLSLAQDAKGWILRSEEPLAELSVSTVNLQEQETSLRFRTAADAVLFYEKQAGGIGMRFDTDGDNEFETELAPEDVNYDGKVTVSDAVAAAKFAAEADDADYFRDVDGDGLITLLDAMQVLRTFHASLRHE